MVIAIDGPAGSGKSTVARGVAAALGFRYLDSGAMYRSVALARLRDPNANAEDLQLDIGPLRIVLDGDDVTDAIRSEAVSAEASRVSADPAVRAAMVARQKELIASGDWVAEGRDIGTVVAPDAALKVFLTAAPEERARRRALELGADPAEVLREILERDERDATRAHSPMVAADDAVQVDTTGRSVEEVVADVVALAQSRSAA
jgi:cytidylate kinase